MRYLLLVFTLLSAIAATVANAQPTFRFTAIPDEDESRLKARFTQVANYFSETLGVDVEYIPVKNYAAAVTAFRNNDVQLAWFGGLSGVQARQLVPGSHAIAQGYEDQFFKTYFIAHKASGLLDYRDPKVFPKAMSGKTFTFGSKGSTSGRLMPEFYLRQTFDKAPEDVFSRVGFSGDHSRTLALVAAGSYLVGALNYQVWESAVADGSVNTDEVNVIWETPTYPDYQWTLRGDVDKTWGKDFSKRVQEALLTLQDPDILAAFPRKSFVPASNDNYAPIADTAVAIGLIDAR